MKLSSEPGVSPAPPRGGHVSLPGSLTNPRPTPLGWVDAWPLLLAAVAVVSLVDPLIYAPTAVPAWSPAAGVALVLVAWFGPRFGAAAVGGCGLVVLLRMVLAGDLPAGRTAEAVGWVAVDTALGVAEAVGGWWLYFHLGRGNRRLLDPHSATQFVLLVPGLVALLGAIPRVAWTYVAEVPDPAGAGVGTRLVVFWLARALGVLVLAPPLLVLVTPWLKHRRLLAGSHWSDQVVERPPPGVAGRGSGRSQANDARSLHDGRISGLGDWIEVAGLACGAAILCLLLSRLHERRELLGWQLWGVQLLLIVWAGLRQGLRGGTVVTSLAALTALVVRQGRPTADPNFLPLLQAHLVAQCAAGLLVATASSWVRIYEASYRQVVSQVPVVIHSARLRVDPPANQTGDGGAAGADRRRRDPSIPGDILRRAEVTLVSAGSLDLLGCPAEHLLGDYHHWLNLIDPEDHVVLLAALEQLALQDQPVSCEYRLLAPPPDKRSTTGDGSPVPPPPGYPNRARWVRDTLAPTRDPAGRLIGWEGVVTDITEQRYLADDLRRTTSMFHTLVANLPAGVFFVQGPYGSPILVNARARQLLGQREDNSAGLDYLAQVYRLYKPDGTLYLNEELPVYQAIRQGRTTMRDDIVVHRPDGRRIPLVTWAAPIHLNPRSTTADAAVWVIEDLTALRQAEAARRQTEGQLRAIIETMAEGLLVQDAREAVVSCNSTAAAFLGTSAEAVCDRPLLTQPCRYVREDGTPLPADDFPSRLALRTGQPYRNVVLGVGPVADGETAHPPARWVLVNAMPFGFPLGPSAAGRIPPAGAAAAGVVTTFSDITAHVHAQEAVRLSEERYRGLVETLPLMVIQTDRDLRLTYINPEVTRVSGYSLEEVAAAAAWSAVVHPDDLPRAAEVVRNAIAGRPDRTEFRYKARDGSERAGLSWAQPRQSHGETVGATVIVVDITRERQLEKELQRSQRLELIGRLSSGIAHDFNNLLAVVLGLTELAQTHLPADHPVTADLRHIMEAGEQAAGLASQLLALSRQRPSPARRIDITHMARRTLDLLRATLRSGIAIELQPAAEQLFILADETRVQQVLMNLCLNARDAMPVGGVLQVSTRLVRPAAGPEEVWLSVKDTGQGMSEDVCRRIFEPFFSTKEGGTGLGLAVVQQIVESYGGRIEVHSQPGQGTRFDICWPRA